MGVQFPTAGEPGSNEERKLSPRLLLIATLSD